MQIYKLRPGLFSSNGRGPPPRYPNRKLVPALVDVSTASTALFNQRKKVRLAGNFKKSRASMICSPRPVSTVLASTCFLLSDNAQARRAKVRKPNRL